MEIKENEILKLFYLHPSERKQGFTLTSKQTLSGRANNEATII